LGVSYHIGMRVVTHSQIALAAHQQLASLNAVDRAGGTGQRHSFVDLGVVAHDRNAANLQAQPSSFLRCAKQPCILAAVALGVMLPSALPKMLIWKALCFGIRQLSLPPPPMTVGAAAVGTGVENGDEPAPL
jgi:hypothetical protein